MPSLDLGQDTVRQRKNLMVTSILLVFIELADVNFGSSVNFFGATLKIGKPEFIHLGLVTFQAYFLWRFYQYFSTDKAYGALVSQYKEYMESRISIAIVKQVCRPRGLSGLNGRYRFQDLSRKSFLKYSIEAAIPDEKQPWAGESIKFDADVSVFRITLSRIFALFGFIFRARILTDYFVPYLLVIVSIYVQFL